MQTRDDIFNTLRDALVELFELDPARVSMDAICIRIWKSTASMRST